MAKIEDFVISKEMNYIYMTPSQNKFVYLTCLLLWISPNVKKHCASYVRVKKYLIVVFMKINDF